MMPDDLAVTLARIETTLSHIGGELAEVKADTADLQKRVSEIEKSLAGRMQPAMIFGAIGALGVLFSILVLLIDRFSQGG
jgi:hypothetical protein